MARFNFSTVRFVLCFRVTVSVQFGNVCGKTILSTKNKENKNNLSKGLSKLFFMPTLTYAYNRTRSLAKYT